MLVIFGLGNPGAKYEGTRHNAGYETLAKLAAFFQCKLRKRCFYNYKQALVHTPNGVDVKLVFPLTFMNNSGDAVKYTVNEGDEVLVLCDQMDLPPGKIRLRKSGSSAGHNGLKSMLSALPQNFMRLYIGIGRPENGKTVIEHVLERYNETDRKMVDQAEAKAVNVILDLVNGKNFDRVLQEANS